ncbi:hypothetical protein ACTQ1N_00090 [Porcincola sp. LCP21S3_C12]|uniref:hypothetical protein n=1 Tax=Porcincola sp. LCP21S3_C12 TaxID=3438798 RepID=UPI003F9A7742
MEKESAKENKCKPYERILIYAEKTRQNKVIFSGFLTLRRYNNDEISESVKQDHPGDCLDGTEAPFRRSRNKEVNMFNTALFSRARSFFDFKITKQTAEAIQPRISETNHRGLLIAVRISSLYFVILFALSLFIHAIFPFRNLYVVTGILDLILYFFVQVCCAPSGCRGRRGSAKARQSTEGAS